MSIYDIIAQFAIIVERLFVYFIRRLFLNLNFLDIVFVVAFVLFLVIGFKRGFVKSILNFLSLIVVAFFAPNISSAFADGFYSKFLENKVNSLSNEIINNNFTNISKSNLDKIIGKPNFLFFHILKNSGACSNSLKNKHIDRDLISKTIKEKILNYVNFILTLLVSAVLLFLFRLFFRRISLKSVPVLGGMDSILGGALGVLEFLFLVFILFNLFNLYCSFFNKEYNNFRIYENVNESLAFKYFKEFSFWKFVK